MYGRGWRDVCLCQGEFVVLVFAMLHLCIFIRGVCLYILFVWWMGREKLDGARALNNKPFAMGGGSGVMVIMGRMTKIQGGGEERVGGLPSLIL